MRYKAAIIIGISIIGFFLYFFILHSLFPTSKYFDKKIAVTQSLELNVPAGTMPYKNLLLHFFLFYPDDLQKKEYTGGSDSTITFNNAETGRGFQIFVVPYSEDRIVPEQFKKDLPSGVIEDPVEILIDGAPAIMFYSKDAVMGDTREVWFIKNGFLYEVTTYRDLDAWLSAIMQSWRFLEF